MKKNILAIILALCMVISMLPATVFAAHDGEQLQKLAAPETIGKLEPAAIEPNAKSYAVNLSGGSNGETELLVSSPAEKGSQVYFLANPDDGYLAEIHFSGLDAEDFVYIGMDIWGFIMPGNKVTLEVKYVEATSVDRDILVRASAGGQYILEREAAKTHESVLMAVMPDAGQSFDPETSVTAEGCDLLYLMADEDGVHYYEIIVGGRYVDIEIRFGSNPLPRYLELVYNKPAPADISVNKTVLLPGDEIILTVVPDLGYKVGDITGFVNHNAAVFFTEIGNHQYKAVMPDADVDVHIFLEKTYRQLSVNVVDGVGGTVKARTGDTQPGTTVTITCTPDDNYRVYSITGVDGLVDKGNNTYTFTMPDRDVVIDVTFRKIYNPITVTVDTGIGGTASADLAEAKAGDIVTLTCVPEEGYRMALISGIDSYTDNGDGTYTFTMPDSPADIHVLFLRHENPFVDVNETHFFYDPVLWAVENGITNGIDDTHFGPFLNTNRAAVVTMLWRWAGSPEPTTTENPFTDVPADSWYTKSVLWAVENGITNGLTTTTFGPGEVCNRAQVVTFLYRYLKAAVPEGTENPFEDVPAGSWYEPAVLWALANGVTTGTDATHFSPNGECLRAQFVTFLYRASLIPARYELHWVINGFQDTPSDYGTVTLSHETAEAGETITATVVPAEGYVLDWVKCEFGTELTQVSDTEYTFVMPEHAETLHVNFVEAPTEPEPTDPEEPDPTDPTEPEEPVKTYTLDVRTNVNAEIIYVDGKTAAAPGESIFFYVNPEPGYTLAEVGLFNPNNEIDLSTIQLYAHEDNLYEFVMIAHDVILNFNFA